MTARTYCMASAKGGSGKTILTATFGAFLAKLGKKVLLIDTDAGTNGLTLLFFKEVMLQSEIAYSKKGKPFGIFDSDGMKRMPEIVTLNNGVDLIPASYNFINTGDVPPGIFKMSLSITLSHLKVKYDYIFIDAQSGSDEVACYSMSKEVSDEVIIVSEYDPMSAAGVERLKGLLREDLTYVRTWVLLNKMLPDFVQSFSDFLEVAKYLNPIPWDAEVVKAYARRKLAIDFENGNEHTLAIMQTLKTLMGDNIAIEIDKWTSDRAASIKQPIENQYLDIEKELETLIQERYTILKRSQKRKMYRVMSITTIITTIITGGFFFLNQYFLKNEMTSFYDKGTLFLIPAVLMSILVVLIEFIFKPILKTPESEIEQTRLQRREKILEEKLRKLEMLKSADLESLIKSRRENN